MSDYNPAFDMPTTPAQALAWLEKQGDPTCATFDHRKAASAARLLGDALTAPNPALGAVTAELARAVCKFPTWPTDPLHAVAVLGEEFGELTKAVLQSVYEPHKVKPDEVRTEAVQTAAMALRFLQSLDAYAYTPGEQHAQESNEDAAIALMRGQSWQDIATCPRGDRRVILLISVNGPNGYVTDPWTGWMNSDGTFARWPHEFPPSHWRAIEPKYPSQPKDTADDQ